ncbi:uncharacterized protein LOC143592735 [Bidens hawaiensis]|uniref:uncharacterized protein LOC143592735 n=1 Tax=Bidens hawaiensis TaxID=980011 RepID=UPI00404A7A00
MATTQLGHSLIPKPTKNVEKNFGLKSSLQKVHGSQSKPKSSSSNLHLPVRELAKKTTKNLTQSSKAASSTRSRLVQVDGANNKSEMVPATLQACKIPEASAPLAAKHFAQHAAANSNNSLSEAAKLTSSGPCHLQEATKGLMISDRLNSSESQDHPSALAKPSGLRKPSPSLRLFDLRTSSESAPLQQTKVQQYMGSDRKYGDMLPLARPPMKSNVITESVRCVALTPGKEFCAPATQSPSPNYMFNTSTKWVPDSNVYQNLVKKITCHQPIFEGRDSETKYKPVIHNEEDGLQSYTASSMSTCGESIQHKEKTISTGVDDLAHAQTPSEQADFKSSDDAPLKVNLDHAQTSWEQENDVSKVVDGRSLPMEEDDVTELKDEADATELKGEADVTDLKGEADVTELKDEADVTELKGVDTSCIPFQSLNTEQRKDDADCVDVFPTKSPRVSDPPAELQNSSSFEGLNIEPTHIIENYRELPVTLLLDDNPPSTEGREPETKYKSVLYNEEYGLQSYIVSLMSAFGQSSQHQEETILTGVDDLVPAQTSWEQADTAKSDDASPKVNSESHLDACSQVFVESHEQGGIGSSYGVLQHEQENNACKVVDDKSLPVEEDDSHSSRTISIGFRDSHSLEDEVGVTELKFINTSCNPFENLNTEQRNDDANVGDVFSTTNKSPRVRDPSAEEGNGIHIDPTTFIRSKAQSNDSPVRYTVRQILNDGPSINSFNIEPTLSIDNKHKLPATLVLHDNPPSTEASPLYKSQLPDTCTANGSINCFEATTPCISALLNSQLSEECAFHNEADINGRLFQEKSVSSAILIEVLGQKQDGIDVELISREVAPLIEFISETASVGDDSLVKSESVLQGVPCTGIYPQSLEKDRLDVAAPTVEAYHVENHKSQEVGLVAEKSQHSHANMSETKPTVQGWTGGPKTHSQFQKNQTLEGSDSMPEEKTTLFLDDRVLMKDTLPSTEKILDSDASAQILSVENSEESSKSVQERTVIVVLEENSDASAQILPAEQVNGDNQHHGFVGITHSVETPDHFTNGKSDSSFSVSQELSTGVETTSLEKEFLMSPQSCCLVGTKTTCMIEAEESKISNGEQIDATPIDGGFQHELDDFIDHKDEIGLMRSNSIKRQDNSLVIHPLNAVPSSDEWLVSFEAAGELLINDYKEDGLQSYTASSMSTFGQPIQHQEETISTGVDDIDNGRTSLEQIKTEKSDDIPPKVNPESHLYADSQVFVESHEQDIVTKGEDYVGSTKCVAPGVESYSGLLPHGQESDVYKVVVDKSLHMEEHDVTELKGVVPSCIFFQSLNTVQRNDDADGAVGVFFGLFIRVSDSSAEVHDIPSSKGLNNEPAPSIENAHKLPLTLVLHDNQSSTEGLHFIPANFIKNNSQLHDTYTFNGSMNCFEATTSCVSALPNTQLPVSCIIPEESSCLEEGTFHNVTDINDHIFQEKGAELISETASVGDDTLVESKSVLQGAQFTITNLQSLEKERADIEAEPVSCIIPEEGSCLEEGTFHNVTDINDHIFQEKGAELISETASVGDDTLVESKSVLQGAQFTGTNQQTLEKERADIEAEPVEVQHQILVENQPQGLVGITHSVEAHDCFTNGKSHSNFSVSQETTSTPESCCLVGTKTTYMIEAEGSKINTGEQVDTTPRGFQHELDDLKGHKDATVLTKTSNSIKRQVKSLAICPPNAVPFSDEWLAAVEAAGEEILTMKRGAVQHSPPDKSLPEPSPWSPVKKKGNQIGPYDCTKYTNAMPTSSQASDQ